MRLSFLPGRLELCSEEEGYFRLTMNGAEILRTRSQRVAVGRFNELRLELDARFPAQELSAEEKTRAFQRILGDWMVGHNNLGGRKKKTSAGSTRTFGG